ncbi:MAG: hypothetical protein HYW71_00450 [Candidatus Niyogibacteria bacterium]|nr:hypothetical protein [Candidatus Niyogibacteria bacterium]
MRLFLIGWCGSLPEVADVAFMLKNRSYEIKYWVVSDDSAIDKSKFSETVFHNSFDAADNLPAAGFNGVEFEFPDKNFVKRFSEAESVVMTMMNKHFELMGIEERKHLYYGMLKYWCGVIRHLKPEAIIFSSIPHAPYEYVIYSIARELNIKTILFEPFWLNDRMLVLNDYKIGSEYVAREIGRNRGKQFTPADISNDLREYYQMQMNKAMDSTPGYMKDFQKARSGKNWLRLKIMALVNVVRSGIFFEKAANFLFKKFRHNLKKEYIRAQSSPDLKRKYVYFPLHYQPECATSPLGDIFVDQLLAAEILSASLPVGWFLYVKEHPTQWWIRGAGYFSYRYKGYYEKMSKLKNTKIVSMQADTYSLIDNAAAVATITGTAGWEAILRQKPALIFGYPWYKHAPGILEIDNVKSCSEALQKIANGFIPSKQEIINYFVALDRGSFRGYFKYRKQILNKISQKENTANLLNVLLKELENIG